MIANEESDTAVDATTDTSKMPAQPKNFADSSSSKAGRDKKNPTPQKKGQKSKSRKKKPRDMPRRPLSSYNYFFREERGRWLEEHKAESAKNGGKKMSGLNMFSAMGKAIAARWKSLTPEEAEPYKAMAENDMERYRREMDEYHVEVKRRARIEASRLDPHASGFFGYLPGTAPLDSSVYHASQALPFVPRQGPTAALHTGINHANFAIGTAGGGGVGIVSDTTPNSAHLATTSFPNQPMNMQMMNLSYQQFLLQQMLGSVQQQQQQQSLGQFSDNPFTPPCDHPQQTMAAASSLESGASIFPEGGSSGPFAAEVTLQQDLLPQQQPSHNQQPSSAKAFMCETGVDVQDMSNANSAPGFPDAMRGLPPALHQSNDVSFCNGAQGDPISQMKAQLMETYMASMIRNDSAVQPGEDQARFVPKPTEDMQAPQVQQMQLTPSMLALLGDSNPTHPVSTATGSSSSSSVANTGPQRPTNGYQATTFAAGPSPNWMFQQMILQQQQGQDDAIDSQEKPTHNIAE